MKVADSPLGFQDLQTMGDWRVPLLNTTLRLSALIGCIWFAAYLISAPTMRWSPETAMVGLALLSVCVAAVRPRWPEAVRLAALQTLFFLPIAIGFALAPPSPASGVILTLPVLVATLYYGRRAGVLAGCGVLGLYFVAGVGWEQHLLPLRSPSPLLQVAKASYWVRVGLGQIFGAGALVSIAVFVVGRAQRALRDLRDLRQSEGMLRTVIDASQDGIWEWNLETDEVRWSNRVYEILAAQPGSFGVTFDRVKELVHPEDGARFLDALKAHLDFQVPFDIELRFRRGDGSYGYFRSRGKTLCDSANKPVRMVGSISDITESRRMDEALRASESLLRQFVKHTPAAVAMFDTDMRYLQTSDRWLKDYRLDGEAVVGRSHYEVFPGIPERWKEIHRRVLGGALERSDEDSFAGPDGAIDWLQWEVQPWRKPDGAIGGLIIFTQLMNDRKRTEQKITDQLTELQRWQRVTLGREERFQQLKREINELCCRFNEPVRYPSAPSIPIAPELMAQVQGDRAK